jgi:hypothetical protein
MNKEVNYVMKTLTQLLVEDRNMVVTNEVTDFPKAGPLGPVMRIGNKINPEWNMYTAGYRKAAREIIEFVKTYDIPHNKELAQQLYWNFLK